MDQTIQLDKATMGSYMRDTEQGTSLLPLDEDKVRQGVDKYNFLTKCFFLSNNANNLDIRLNRELYQVQISFQVTLKAAEVGGREQQHRADTDEPATDQLLPSFSWPSWTMRRDLRRKT